MWGSMVIVQVKVAWFMDVIDQSGDEFVGQQVLAVQDRVKNRIQHMKTVSLDER
jgi:hypothetical protein